MLCLLEIQIVNELISVTTNENLFLKNNSHIHNSVDVIITAEISNKTMHLLKNVYLEYMFYKVITCM